MFQKAIFTMSGVEVVCGRNCLRKNVVWVLVWFCQELLASLGLNRKPSDEAPVAIAKGAFCQIIIQI